MQSALQLLIVRQDYFEGVRMKERPGKELESQPSSLRNEPLMQTYLTTNKEQIKHLESELLAMGLPTSAVATVLRLPRCLLEYSDNQ
jgi:hypothetical protein